MPIKSDDSESDDNLEDVEGSGKSDISEKEEDDLPQSQARSLRDH